MGVSINGIAQIAGWFFFLGPGLAGGPLGAGPTMDPRRQVRWGWCSSLVLWRLIYVIVNINDMCYIGLIY